MPRCFRDGGTIARSRSVRTEVVITTAFFPPASLEHMLDLAIRRLH
ncbi:MAG: hypothetical protein RLY72_236 [Planctomycetota bacterium]|jgi:hypothetical protein